MSNWYRVVKTIKGHRYVYLQQTYREGNRVRTRNRYLGPAGSETAASGSAGGKSEPAGSPSGIASAVVGGLAGFGKEAARQFDAPRWGTDAASQLGLGNVNTKLKGKTVTTTKRPRRRRAQITGRAPFYDPEDVSPSGRIQTGAIEKVFARIPEGTTDPGGYIVKRNGKLFPTTKLTAELQAFIGIALASDGSIIDGPHINKIGFTQDVALQRAAQPTDTPANAAVTTTNASSDDHPDDAAHGANPSRSNVQGDAHRKYFTNEDIRITAPQDAVRLCREMLHTEDALDRDKEHFYVLHLNARRRVRMIEMVSVGTLTASVVHPRETFRQAISQGSYAIIIAHNHPSGEVDPSDENSRVTKLMVDAGNVIGQSPQTTPVSFRLRITYVDDIINAPAGA